VWRCFGMTQTDNCGGLRAGSAATPRRPPCSVAGAGPCSFGNAQGRRLRRAPL
jgi:hypothetical protein